MISGIMLLTLLVVWFALSPIVALAVGAFLRSGRGPEVEGPLTAFQVREPGNDLGSRLGDDTSDATSTAA